MKCDLLIRDVHLADFAPGNTLEQRDAALLVADGRIFWRGPMPELPRDVQALDEWSGAGAWLTPGFIDCHTHLVWAGNRAD
jgi:imidazolonepropionase